MIVTDDFDHYGYFNQLVDADPLRLRDAAYRLLQQRNELAEIIRLFDLHTYLREMVAQGEVSWEHEQLLREMRLIK